MDAASFCYNYFNINSAEAGDSDNDWDSAYRLSTKVAQTRRRVAKISEAVRLKVRARKQKLGEELYKHSEVMQKKMTSAKVRRYRHKITFAGSMCDLVVTSFLIGHCPQDLYVYHTMKFFWLFSIRAVNYGMQSMQYYLLDFCYWPNLTLLVYCWIYPEKDELLLAVLGSSGLLLVAAMMFRNSFIPHSIDRMTCVYSHVFPPLTAWTLMWIRRPDGDLVWTFDLNQFRMIKSPTRFSVPSEVSFVSVFMPSAKLYIAWAITYYGLQWVILKDAIVRFNRQTLYKQMVQKYEASLPEVLQSHLLLVYIVVHAMLFVVGLGWACLLPSTGQAIVIAAASWCVFYNGANYYIEHFWKVYEQLYTETVEEVDLCREDESDPLSPEIPSNTCSAGARAQRRNIASRKPSSSRE